MQLRSGYLLNNNNKIMQPTAKIITEIIDFTNISKAKLLNKCYEHNLIANKSINKTILISKLYDKIKYDFILANDVKSYCKSMIYKCKSINSYNEASDELIYMLHDIKEFNVYRNLKVCVHGDYQYNIPFNLWIQITGLTYEDINELNNCYGAYLGNIFVDYNNKVTIVSSE